MNYVATRINNVENSREAPRYSGESWLHLKTRWKDGPLDGRKKTNENNKNS
jgi:hypothetical protein